MSTLAVITDNEFARENNIPVISFSKELNNLDMSYDLIRNRAVIDQSDILIVLWDGKNTFVKQSIDYAQKQKKDLRIFHYSPA